MCMYLQFAIELYITLTKYSILQKAFEIWRLQITSCGESNSAAYYSHRLTEVMAWISKQVNDCLSDVIINVCRNLNSLSIGHEYN